ncbi:MAG: Uncharacterized protein Athens071426_496 [Parcubacteria group bacterium Athens0714_26]|nr:MAG: Uncharacterized protein Athens101426_476 [Parcubacteria group bacterium Athens1014_26]TSD02446.1 MAG: Uncharacterized protein Athens071426_496 [Parcubacteria group bacterium Athens0714_26]
MNVSVVYLFSRFLHRIIDFTRHWYVDGLLNFMDWTYGLLERFDRFFAFKINVKKWTEPIYQDYSFIGRILGIIFRTVRIFMALIFYAIFILAVAVVFLAWSAVPIFVVYKIINNL